MPVSPPPVSPFSPIEFFDIPATAPEFQSEASTNIPLEENEPCAIGRDNSLTFQLHCVSSASSFDEGQASPRSVVTDVAKIAFPYLPASISDSSCESSSLSSGKGDLQVSSSEQPISAKEAYGWFVEMDDGEDAKIGCPRESPNPFDRFASTHNLAFSAPTAPKQVNYDAEVEWAKSVDTVDDVLGDFF